MPAKVDEFSQAGFIQVTETAANTLTFAGITIMTSFMQNSAMVIHQVEYMLGGTDINFLAANNDVIFFGLVGSDGMSTINLDDPEVYDLQSIDRHDMGTAANATLVRMPVLTDFTNLPGGGIMVPADRVYGFVQGGGLSGPSQIEIRFRFTVLELAPAQYLELAQTLRVLR